MTENRTRQTVRFLKWVREYPGYWQLITTPGMEEMNPSMMQSLMERLEGEGLFELIFVMLAVHRKTPFVDYFTHAAFEELLLRHWEEESGEILRLFRAELE